MQRGETLPVFKTEVLMGIQTSESNRKASEQRRNEIFAEQLRKNIIDFYMDPSTSTVSVPNKRKTQLDENSNCSPPRKNKNV